MYGRNRKLVFFFIALNMHSVVGSERPAWWTRDTRNAKTSIAPGSPASAWRWDKNRNHVDKERKI